MLNPSSTKKIIDEENGAAPYIVRGRIVGRVVDVILPRGIEPVRRFRVVVFPNEQAVLDQELAGEEDRQSLPYAAFIGSLEPAVFWTIMKISDSSRMIRYRNAPSPHFKGEYAG